MARVQLQVGSPAPPFRLRDAVAGGEHTPESLTAGGPLVLKWIRGTW